jgi:hypothetical protein
MASKAQGKAPAQDAQAPAPAPAPTKPDAPVPSTKPKKKTPKGLLAPALAAPYELANDLYNLITNNKPSTDSANTLYDELMAKEKAVLDTIQRVVDDKAEERRVAVDFVSTPLHRIPQNLIYSMAGLLADWTKSPPASVSEAMAVLTKDQRMIYAGITLVLIALFLIFIQISDTA